MRMSFLNKCNFKISVTKTSLQACSKKGTNFSRVKNFLCSKRISPYLFSQKEGSVTVEAAIAIPVFLFAILNLLSIILLFGEYSTILADMHQRAKMLSVHAHVQEDGWEVNNDLIMQTKVIKIKPLISFVDFPYARTIVNCRVRKWTGYDVTKAQKSEEKEEWVYITPYGESYHTCRQCRYLSLKIKAASVVDIKEYRNQSGEIYRLCENCEDNGINGICFYTEHGNRYHTSLYCSGLKRTIRTVKKTETGNRHECSACFGDGG